MTTAPHVEHPQLLSIDTERMSPLARFPAIRRSTAGTVMVLAFLISAPVVPSAQASAEGVKNTSSDQPSNYVLQESGGTMLLAWQAQSTGVIKTITVSLPAGTTEATGDNLQLGAVYGVGAGEISLQPDALTYVISSPVQVNAGDQIAIQAIGVHFQPSSHEFTAVVVSKTSEGTVIDEGFCTLFAESTSTSSTTKVTIQVAQAMEISVDTPDFSVELNPADPTKSDVVKPVTVSVRTNAGQGYSLSVSDSGLRNVRTVAKPSHIQAIDADVDANGFPTNAFGFTASGAAAQPGLVMQVSTNYHGYRTDPAIIAFASRPTGNTADRITFMNRVKVGSSTPAGTYADTITYTVAPRY